MSSARASRSPARGERVVLAAILAGLGLVGASVRGASVRAAPRAAASGSIPALAPSDAALSRSEAELLRRAVLESQALTAGRDPVLAAHEWLDAESGLDPAALDSLHSRLRSDAALRLAVLELASQRANARSEPRGAFVAWWDPRQEGEGVAASGGLSLEDAAELTAFLHALARDLGIAPPTAIPYFLDRRAPGARVRAPNRVRWGIVTPEPRDRAAVAKALLLEIGDSAFVVEPLAALRACENRECRRALLDRARNVIIRSGYVPIRAGLEAAAFAGEDDPAFASALLVVDRIDRLHPGRTFAALLAQLEQERGARALRTAFFHATGEAPRRLDTLVQAEIAEWARARPAGAP